MSESLRSVGVRHEVLGRAIQAEGAATVMTLWRLGVARGVQRLAKGKDILH